MASEFSSHLPSFPLEEGWKEEIPLLSKRFSFFKVRIFGTLQMVKCPGNEYTEDFLTVESLRKEFNIAFRLNHPSIIRYYKFENNCLYEEYVEGHTLRQLLDADDDRLKDPRFVVAIVTQLFDALGYLHKNGIVHRDIKPENLIVTRIGDRLKIIDFGAAESDECDTTPGFTEANLAPEQKGKDAGWQTDIYQAGLVVEALAAKSKLHKKWHKLIAGATHPDPLKRFRNAEEVLEAIPAKRKGFNYTVISIVAVLLSAMVTAGYFLKTHFETRQPEVVETVETVAPVQPDETPTPVAAASSPTSPAPSSHALPISPVTAAPSREAEAPEKGEKARLTKEINRFVTDTYASHLKRLCDATPPLDKNGFIEKGTMLEFDSQFKKALNKSFEFGESLASKYPAYRDFIEETLYKKMESVGSVYMSRFYRPNEIAAEKMDL